MPGRYEIFGRQTAGISEYDRNCHVSSLMDYDGPQKHDSYAAFGAKHCLMQTVI